ncbi:glycosyltransferase [Nostoc sp. NIES-2111]
MAESIPLVTIITPILNARPFLAEAVESVLAQTFPDWELILIDDGSTDGSLELARSLAKQHGQRIRTFVASEHGRKGAAAARNLGIEKAQGKYLAFLDADDVFEPHKLEVQSAILESDNSLGMVYGPTRWWWPDSPKQDWTERPGVPTERIYEPPDLVRRVLLGRWPDIPCTCGVMVRRSAVMAVHGFDDCFSLYEDQTLWAKLFLREKTYVSRHVLSRYRQHARSTSALAAAGGEYDQMGLHPAQLAFLRWLREYAASQKQGSAISRQLTRAILPYEAETRRDHIKVKFLALERRCWRHARSLAGRLQRLTAPLSRGD